MRLLLSWMTCEQMRSSPAKTASLFLIYQKEDNGWVIDKVSR